MENFLRGHVAAFSAWNGCGRVVLYDNLRSAVLDLMMEKRLSQLVAGDGSLIRGVGEYDRIDAVIVPTAARTGWSAHFQPSLA
jgi:hypothetical protein